jgi:hypothetical protein
MNIEEFEDCFASIYSYGTYSPNTAFHDWFMKNHQAYHGSYDLLSKKKECLRDIYYTWIKADRKPIYFWLDWRSVSTNGIGHAHNEDVLISHGSIKLNGTKLKQFYRNEVLNDILQ